MDNDVKNLKLKNGSNIAVIGGGPSGSLTSFFILDIAKRIDLQLKLDIYEARDYTKCGPVGCNHCGGIVSESLVQMLAAEGIILPSSVVQRSIDSYVMHTDSGQERIETPLDEKRIAAVYRGAGPLGNKSTGWESFDQYLLDLTVKKGANVINQRVKSIDGAGESLHVNTKAGNSIGYDLIVGAVGLNPASLKLFSNHFVKYDSPSMTKTFICEFELGDEIVRHHFGNSMHVFLLDIPRLKFAALIPKGNYVTMVLLGDDIDKNLVENIMRHPEIVKCFPDFESLLNQYPCQCYPKINTGAAVNAYADRMVMVGDCAVSKLYKNGIGAAYVAGKAAATTAVLKGISGRDFKKHYHPVCQSIEHDNQIGKFIFKVTDLIHHSSALQRGILAVVNREQKKNGSQRHMSTVLWDTFTGSSTYRKIILMTLRPMFWGPLLRQLVTGFISKGSAHRKVNEKMQTNQLGRKFHDGEIIIKQGEPGDCLYVIQSGKVEIIKENINFERKLTELGKEDFFGEMALFEKKTRSCTVKAVGEVSVLTVDKKTLLSRIQSDPSLTFRILEKMSRRIRNLSSEISQLEKDH
ncbi:MAG: cyclic nucleotide-binding domain-containing protein [Planctomycetes bacterium]|nr:cyclic nucleotide-binding domain-containing protein [Planctomycetota bacterium]